MKAFPQRNSLLDTGMDLRDYFAAEAIKLFNPINGYEWIAVNAYALADELMKARGSKP